MKRITLFLMALCLSLQVLAGNFVMINFENQQDLRNLFNRQDITIHYYNDNFVLASAAEVTSDMMVLDENSFSSNKAYFIVYCAAADQQKYIEREKNNMEVLYGNDNILVVKPLNDELKPAKNDGMVAVTNDEARLAEARRDIPTITKESSDVRNFIEQVSIDNLTATVQYLENLENRYYNSTKAYEASDWILEQFEALNADTEILEIEEFPFNIDDNPNNPSSPNIIAIQYGTKYPDEYVICGSHYDSYSESGKCPGADDNATGVATVLETARILSQYEFERSIIYCTFSAEEIGMRGSMEYAKHCKNVMGFDVVGYFNNDMNGYLNPGDEIHIDLIYPNTAEALGNYYINVASVYFPEMEVVRKDLTYGSSDHESFNNVGYMGIYPFEDVDHISPYIHTGNDVIGPSVNSFEMSKRYTQMNIASVAHMAVYDDGESVAENTKDMMSLYPNPVKDILTIKSENNSLNEVQIVNTLGQVVKELSFEGQTEVDVRDLESGVYFVKIISDNNVTEKIIVE